MAPWTLFFVFGLPRHHPHTRTEVNHAWARGSGEGQGEQDSHEPAGGVATSTGDSSHFSSVAFSPDGKRIVSGSYDNTVRVWNSESGEAVSGPFGSHTNAVSSVVFSPDGKRIVSGSHTYAVISVAFSPDGKWIVSGSGDNTVRVWDSESGQGAAGTFDAHTGTVSSVAFSPDGKRIVSGSYDNTVRVWDSGEVDGPVDGHTHWASSVVLSPGKRFSQDGIIARSDDKTILGWDETRKDVGETFRGIPPVTDSREELKVFARSNSQNPHRSLITGWKA
ncbi:WD40-repeat-containing domain protein [Mycena sp. CBHHK59/15]|nr:WD40-repeat-containing domain protein [Mycena sp. CBHHK59/15]